MSLLKNHLKKLAKALVCPFFYFTSLLTVDYVYMNMTDAFEANYGEAIEGTLILIYLVGPIGLIILSIPSLIFLKISKKLWLLGNNVFLASWGFLMGLSFYGLLFIAEKISDAYYQI